MTINLEKKIILFFLLSFVYGEQIPKLKNLKLFTKTTVFFQFLYLFRINNGKIFFAENKHDFASVTELEYK